MERKQSACESGDSDHNEGVVERYWALQPNRLFKFENDRDGDELGALEIHLMVIKAGNLPSISREPAAADPSPSRRDQRETKQPSTHTEQMAKQSVLISKR